MTEPHPHIVYPKYWQRNGGDVALFPNYAEAFSWWKQINQSISDPHLIAVVGRVIDPSTPVIDPNE